MRSKLLLILVLLSQFMLVSAQHTNLNDSLYTIEDSISIPLKSGKSISIIVVRKKANTNPLPAVLFYTTYFQGSGDAVLGKRSASRDYVGVLAYARGIKTDLNDYSPYEFEGTDIYQIIDWISRQPWCDGTVGMLGGSYTGFSQWATAKNLHPALKTIVPQVAVMPGFDVPMENNVQTSNSWEWAYTNIYKSDPIRRSLPFEWFENGTSYRSLDSLIGHPNPIFQKWMQHTSYDDYWKLLVPSPQEYAKINIPILSTTGYYDGSQISSLQYFKLHTKYNKNANHYFVIGPYDHWGGQRNPSQNLMGYEIDPVANVSMSELAYQWLDYILKNGPKPSLLEDKVNYQVMGTNEWKHVASLDKMNDDTLTFFLSKNGLVMEKPKNPHFEEQIVDFKNREDQNNFYTPEIIFDTLDTSGGLVFMTEPFQNDFSINGSFIGTLSASINKKDLDVSLALYELSSTGKYFFLTRYVGRASYAKDNTKRQLLKPGQKESIPIRYTRFVSKKINKGSRLVVLLNTNKHPFEIINYGSGKEVVDETIQDADSPLVIKWHNDSTIKIPISNH